LNKHLAFGIVIVIVIAIVVIVIVVVFQFTSIYFGLNRNLNIEDH